MKTFIALFALLSFSAFAYEIEVGTSPVPAEVQAAIRTSFDKECGSVTSNVKVLKLERVTVVRTSVDQGYVDENYSLVFRIDTEWLNPARPDKLYIQVVLPTQERSGNYEPYVTGFQTVYGSDGDPICNN